MRRLEAAFTRATDAHINGKLMPSGAPRFDTGKSGKALLVEEGTTNLVATISSWTASNVSLLYNQTDVWSGTAAVRLTANNVDAGIYSPAFNCTASGLYTFSVYLKQGTAAKSSIWIESNNGSWGGYFAFLTVQWSNLALTPVSSGVTISASSIVAVGSGWYRLVLTVTAPVGATQLRTYIQPGGLSGTTGTCYASHPQCENKAYPTTFMDYGGVRNAETCTIPTASALPLATVSNWCKYNNDMTSGVWIAGSGVTVNSSNTVTWGVGATYLYQILDSSFDGIAAMSVSVILSGTAGKKINLYAMNGVASIGKGMQITLTSAPTAYRLEGVNFTGGTQLCVFLHSAGFSPNGGTVPAADSNQTITIGGWLVEKSATCSRSNVPATYNTVPQSMSGALPFTVEFWAKALTDRNTYQMPLNIWPLFYISWNYGGASTVALSWYDGATQRAITASYPTADLLGWHHYALVWDSGVWNLYFDGSLAATTQQTSLSWTIPTDIELGSTGISLNYPFDGLIEDIRISNKARNAAEIQATYQRNGSPVVDDRTTVLFPFDGNLYSFTGSATTGPSIAFLSAAKRPYKEPCLVVEIENPGGKQLCTTTADWNASKSLSVNLGADENPGAVQLKTYQADTMAASSVMLPYTWNNPSLMLGIYNSEFYLITPHFISSGSHSSIVGIWKFNPSTLVWSKLTLTGVSLPTGWSCFTGCMIGSKIYLFGGTSRDINGTITYSSTLYVIDVASSNTVSIVNSSGPKRYLGALMTDGTDIWYSGGLNPDDPSNPTTYCAELWKYTISSGVWSNAFATGAGALTSKLWCYYNGVFYIMSDGGTATTWYSYTVSSNTWGTPTALPVAPNGSAAFVSNGAGLIYYLPCLYNQTMREYSIAGNSWTTRNTDTLGYAGAAVFYHTSKVWLIAPSTYGSSGVPYPTADCITWTPAGTVWTRDKRFVPGNTYEGCVYATGGSWKFYTFNGGPTWDKVWEYDKSSEAWSEKASCPVAAITGATITNAGNGKFYMYGGVASGTKRNTLYEYDASNNTWATKTANSSDTNGRAEHCAWVYNGKLYVYGGIDQNNTLLNTLYECNLTTFTWSSKTVSGISARRNCFCYVNATSGKAYIIGGHTTGTFPAAEAWEVNLSTFAWTQKTTAAHALVVTGMSCQAVNANGTGVILASRADLAGYYLSNIHAYDSTNDLHIEGSMWSYSASDNGAPIAPGAIYWDTDGTSAFAFWRSSTYPQGQTTQYHLNSMGIYKRWLAPVTTSETMTTKSIGPFVDEQGNKFTGNSLISIDDLVAANTTLTYTARGSDDNSTWTNLGAVTDGSSLAPYKYYDVTATFGSNGTATAELYEIAIEAGNQLYAAYSTHPDYPTLGMKPLVLRELNTLSSKIELMKLGSTGEVSPKLFYCKDTFDLIKNGYLRNKKVNVKLGFFGGSEFTLAAADFYPIFCGLWYDAKVDWKSANIQTKTRTILTRFQKVSLPRETAVAAVRDASNVIPITYNNQHMMDVVVDIYDRMGMGDRFINRTSFSDVKADLGTDYRVTRTLDKDNKEEATKLLEELSVISGVWFIQGSDGKVAAKKHDPTTAIRYTLDPSVCTISPIDLGQENLYTRQHIYYGLIAGKNGSSETDYLNVYVLINQNAEINWGLNKDVPPGDPDYQKNPGYQKNWFDKWNISTVARTALAARMESWFATPKTLLKITDLPLGYFDIEPGDFVGISGIQLPISGQTWGTLCSDVKYMVMSKTLDTNGMKLSLDLREV